MDITGKKVTVEELIKEISELTGDQFHYVICHINEELSGQVPIPFEPDLR